MSPSKTPANPTLHPSNPPSRVKARGINGLAIGDNTFENSFPSSRLVTLFGCADVRISGNTISGPDGKGTILYGQMNPMEIKAIPDPRWILKPGN